MPTTSTKILTSLLGAAALGAATLAAYPERSPATPRPAVSAQDLQAAVTVAALIDAAQPIPEVPDVAGYERGCGKHEGCSFGPAWTDDYDGPGAHDGCDTRNNALTVQLTDREYRSGTHNCVVVAGTLDDPYTGRTIAFTKTDASKVQIDHVYPLGRAWDMGAATWPIETRIAFANDLDRNLLAVDGDTNRQKSSKGPDTWMPPNTAYGCEYAARYLTVAHDYQLAVTDGDIHAAATACGLDTPTHQEN